MKGYKIVLASDERYKNAPVRGIRLFSERTEEEKKEWAKGEHVYGRLYTEEEKLQQLKRMNAINEEYAKIMERYKIEDDDDEDDDDGAYTDEELLERLNRD